MRHAYAVYTSYADVLAATQAKGNGQSVNNTPYTMEYMFIFTLENDSNGELKIIEIKEFLDSLYFKTFYESAL
jgi:ketosteroid isomerase-like protein